LAGAFKSSGESTRFLTKIVALAMQMLDGKPTEEPVLSVEEQTREYEA
jgi:hypothetical protein